MIHIIHQVQPFCSHIFPMFLGSRHPGFAGCSKHLVHVEYVRSTNEPYPKQRAISDFPYLHGAAEKKNRLTSSAE